MAEKKEKLLSEVMRDRRTTPNFGAQPVQDADLDQIIQAGVDAPSSYNAQPWRFVVVRDPELRSKLAEASRGQARVAQAPVVIVACGDPEAWRKGDLEEMLRIAKEQGYGTDASHNYVREKFPKLMQSVDVEAWLNRQVMIAFTQMMLMAEALGYDTAPMEGFEATKVRVLLGIPGSVFVVAMLCIGHLEGSDKRFGGRFTSDHVVYHERWGGGTGE